MNDNLHDWHWYFDDSDFNHPTFDAPCFILIERDNLFIEGNTDYRHTEIKDIYGNEYYPIIRKARLKPNTDVIRIGNGFWWLLDVEEDEEELLQHCNNVIAWRYIL